MNNAQFIVQGTDKILSSDGQVALKVANTPNSWGMQPFIHRNGYMAYRVFMHDDKGNLSTCVVNSHTWRPNITWKGSTEII